MNVETISQTVFVWLAAVGLKILGVEAGLPAPEQHLAVSNPAMFERQDGHAVAAAH